MPASHLETEHNQTRGADVIGRINYSDETHYYYLKDHPPVGGQALGSVRFTIDEDGEVIGYDDYYPFGLQMPERSWNQANPFDDQKFTGHFLESACRRQSGRQEGSLGLYHAQARAPVRSSGGYDPVTGRFLGIDAMRGMYPGISSYLYVANNPVIYMDPDGNEGIRVLSGVISGIVDRITGRSENTVDAIGQRKYSQLIYTRRGNFYGRCGKNSWKYFCCQYSV